MIIPIKAFIIGKTHFKIAVCILFQSVFRISFFICISDRIPVYIKRIIIVSAMNEKLLMMICRFGKFSRKNFITGAFPACFIFGCFYN